MIRLHCLAAALVLSLAACATVNPLTMARLYRLDPLTADPGAFVVALDLPPGLAVPSGAAQLELKAVNSVSGEALDGAYALDQQGHKGGTTLFRVAAEDQDELRGFQGRVTEWKAATGRKTRGEMSVGVTGCSIGAGPQAGAKLSVRISLDSGESFLPLVTNAPLSAVTDQPGVADLHACDGVDAS